MSAFIEDLCKCVNAVGYGNLMVADPELAIKYMIKNMYPKRLKENMERSAECRKDIRTEVKSFIRELIEESKILQRTNHESRKAKQDVKNLLLRLFPLHADKCIRYYLKDCDSC